MTRFHFRNWLILSVVALWVAGGVSSVMAGNIDPALDGSKYAFGENVGWVNFEPVEGPGVTVTGSAVSGMAWGENIGWLNLSPTNGGGVVNDGTGVLSGFAWGENVGWVNFAPTTSGVSINACGEFSGRAWGENIGWITFRSTGQFPYGVTTSWQSPFDGVAPLTTATFTPMDSGWVNQDIAVLLTASDCGVGVDSLHYMLNSNPEVVTSNTSTNFTISTEGTNTVFYFATDGAANIEGAQQLTVMIDKTAPLITMTTPANNATYIFNEAVTADYGVIDPLSGVSLITGTVLDGDSIDTSSTGLHSFTVTASDQAGNLSEVTHTYTVEAAGNVDPSATGEHFAYGENIGWVNFQPSYGPGVTVTDTTVEGMAWGENIGWVNFNPTTGGGVVNDGLGNLSGYAWAENVGWISFSCVNTNSCATGTYGVTINPNTGEFSGHAWGENIGWISFRSTGPNPFGVTTSWDANLQADLSVLQSADPDPTTINQLLVYTLTVTNNGPSPSTNVIVTDTLPAGVFFRPDPFNVEVSENCLESLPGTITCTVGGLASGAEAVLIIAVSVPSVPGLLPNNVNVAGAEADLNPTNNNSQLTTIVQNFTPRADLEMTIMDQFDPVMIGLPFDYTFTITNLGPDVATDAEVTIHLPSRMNVNSAVASVGVCNGTGPVTCQLGDFPVSSATVTMNVTPTQAGVQNVEASVVGDSSVSDPIFFNGLNIIETTGVFDGPTPPVANAGANQILQLNLPGQFDGSGSLDSQGLTPLTYAWQLTDVPIGSAATLSNATTATPSFVADLVGTYRAELVVTNSVGTSSFPDEVIATGSHPFEYINVGDTNTPIPGETGNFTDMRLPAISGDQVAYRGVGEDHEGIYLRDIFDPNSLVAVADVNTPIPGGSGTFSGFSDVSLNNGDITFYATGPSGQIGIYSFIGDVLDVVADLSTPLPGGTGTFSAFGNPWIYHGMVVFWGAGSQEGEEGIYTTAGGTLRVVADTTTPVPNGGGNFTGFDGGFSIFPTGQTCFPSLDYGKIVFCGTSSGQEGIYLEDHGTLSTVADLNTPIPGGSGTFTLLGGSTIAAQIENDKIVFRGLGTDNQQGLYSHANGVLSVVVDQSFNVLTSAPATPFQHINSNFAGQGFGLSNGFVSFLAAVEPSDEPLPRSGIFTTLGGAVSKVIGNDGDVILGETVFGVGTYGHGIDGSMVTFNVRQFGEDGPANFVAVSALPEITIQGDNPAIVTVGDPYNDAGALAFDQGDGDLSSSIVVTGLPIDTSVPGSFFVTYSVTDSDGYSDQATRTVLVQTLNPQADLELTISDAFDPVPPGQSYDYSLNVTNNGPDVALGVEVDIQLPTGVTLNSASPSVGTCSGTGPVTCSLGNLGVTSSAVTVNITADLAGVKNFLGSVIGDGAVPDPNMSNNTDISETTQVGDQVFVVNTTDDVNDTVCDAAHCSLREAIIQANAAPGEDLILFDILGTGPHIIQPESPYILITPMAIEGYSQSGAAFNTLPAGTNATLQIELDGSLAVGSGVGLDIRGGNTVVRGLVINRFAGNAIRLDTNGGNVIEGNYIGTDRTGLIDLGNGSDGIQTVNGSAGNMIGGYTLGARNVIAGNTGDGIDLNTNGNVIVGNYIGVNATGMGVLGNATTGIQVAGSNNVLGGTTVAERNVISANGRYGVRIVQSTSTNNVVQGNYIGTDTTGTVDLGNTFDGVIVHDAPTNMIGGVVAGAGNVISGNDRHGILFQLANATENQVQGNYIGTNASGTGAIQNGINGVHIAVLATHNIIGGTTPGARNVISGNSAGSGIIIGTSVGPLANHNVVMGNFIGTDVTGTAALANATGVWLTGADNVIGGTVPGARNIISGNSQRGITFSAGSGVGALNNLIQGNFIGTDVTGTVALGNGFEGIFFTNAANNNTIEGNVISGNNKGITLGLSDQNIIRGNLIGLNAAGTEALGNTQEGIRITSPNHTIGGTTPGARNVISGNGDSGIIITGVDATDNVVRGNYIGTNAGGTTAMANSGAGVLIAQANGNTIGGITGTTPGGSCAGACNVISGNSLQGILINTAGGTADNNTVLGNFIGTNVTGSAAIPNGSMGVHILGGSNNTIGGTTANARNVISGNASYGIRILNGSATGNLVQGNYIGTDAMGKLAIENIPTGIEISGVSGNTIGGINPTFGAFCTAPCNLISGNSFKGVSIIGADAMGNIVHGNFIGTDVDGSASLGNCIGVGLALDTHNNHIGGSTIGAGNLISGNSCSGVAIASGATNNMVEGNVIGPDVTGTAAVGLQVDGVNINDSPANTIGGAVANAGNVISGNNRHGIQVSQAGSQNNLVQGNFIGTTAAGTAALGNGERGIVLTSLAGNTTIGGVTPDTRNVISGNVQSGILMTLGGPGGSSGNVVIGNFIGTDVSGIAPLSNGLDGIRLLEVSDNTIGGVASDAGNVISGNARHGVQVSGTAATANVVEGNFIGTNATGTATLGNAEFGVLLNAGAHANRVGGLTPTSRNVLSDNFIGVQLSGDGTSENVVQGNLIGTDVSGTVDLGNSFSGVQLIAGASSNTIGGDDTTPGARNIISGNDNQAMLIQDSTTSGNLVMGNYIGTDISGAIALPNANGVEITDAAGNTIGGTTAGSGNVISGNSPNVTGSSHGIQIQGSQATNNVVQGNFIGTAAGGTTPLGNANVGVLISDLAGDTTIGGIIPGAGNVISANGANGVLINTNRPNVIQGNFIGTDLTGTGNLGNGANGVSLSTSVLDTTISGNTIGFNAVNGVRLSSGPGNAIQGNSIFSNGQLGIDLGGDGVTPNDPGDADLGSNNLQNFPVVTTVIETSLAPSVWTLRGTLDSVPNTAFAIEVFEQATCDASGFGEGEQFIGSVAVTTDSTGFGEWALPVGAPAGRFFTATATDPNGNTSEFSRCVGDADLDGLTDPVDTSSQTFSNPFSNIDLGGSTSGFMERISPITEFSMADAGDDGLWVSTRVQLSAPALLRNVCGGLNGLKVFSNTHTKVTCGSILVGVANGMVELEVEVTGETATVMVNEGNEITYEPTTGTFEVPDTNTEPIVVELDVQGQPSMVTLEAGNEVSIDAEEGTFTTPPDNPNPVVVMVGDEEITVEPGETSRLLFAVQDSFLRGIFKNKNEGANHSLQVRKLGKNRSLVGFDMSNVSLEGLTKATLILTIKGSPYFWGSQGREVNAHRVLESWTEGNGKNFHRGQGSGVTWKCATDTKIQNFWKNCWPKWKGGNFASPTASGVVHTDGMTGEVEWDVTVDVLAGADYGWLIKKKKEHKFGLAQYYSKEGASAIGEMTKSPRLFLEYATQ